METDTHTWELILKDGRVIDIPPQAVDTVRKRRDAKQPIHLKHEDINYYDIQEFRRTGKLWGQQLLAEEAAQAFGEAIINEDESIKTRWVKKQVSQQQWHKHYSAIPSYKLLSNEDGLTTIAFRLPVHLVDTSKTPYCNPSEVNTLTQH